MHSTYQAGDWVPEERLTVCHKQETIGSLKFVFVVKALLSGFSWAISILEEPQWIYDTSSATAINLN